MTQDREFTEQDAEQITRVEELAYELSIDEVMTRDVVRLHPDMTMLNVLDLFKQHHISGAPVEANGKLAGIISIEDLIRCLRDGRIDRKVSDYMTSDVITARNTDQVVEALKVFHKSHVGRLPVVDESGKLVGVLTKGDITDGLLKALQKDLQSEEVIRYRASHLFEDIVSDRTSLILRYSIKKDDFIHGGEASNHIKKALLRLGATPQIARRCGIAAYEAEMNLIIHTNNGGVLRVEVEPEKITMEAYDDGPGIDDIVKVMEPGYSTAPPSVRAKGFGAGMGLKNIKNCVDEMTLFSSKEKGTNLFMIMYLEKATAPHIALSKNEPAESH